MSVAPGELVWGVVRGREGHHTVVELPGGLVGELTSEHQTYGEELSPHQPVAAIVVDVGERIQLSRRSAQLVVRLLEHEVPELLHGIVRVEGVARDPGVRTKIALSSSDPDIDPIGACVGEEGRRIRPVVEALGGEPIDLIPYTEEPTRYACFALAPAPILKIYIDDEARVMQLVVPDDQLEVAIGPSAVNLRLAAQLVGWQLDLFGASRDAELQAQLD